MKLNAQKHALDIYTFYFRISYFATTNKRRSIHQVIIANLYHLISIKQNTTKYDEYTKAQKNKTKSHKYLYQIIHNIIIKKRNIYVLAKVAECKKETYR